MREALAARSGRDFITASAPRRGAKGRAGLAARGLRLAVTHVKPLSALALLVAVGGAITLNAVLWQERVHPAPLFGSSERPLRMTAAPTPPPLPPSRPAGAASPQGAPSATAPNPSAASPSVAALPPPAPARPAARDSIADLIRGGETGAVSRMGATTPEATRSAAAGQRALVALGYGPLAADGLVGRETRAAIERFERDRRLPVTGEFNPRTLKELAARSGLPLD